MLSFFRLSCVYSTSLCLLESLWSWGGVGAHSSFTCLCFGDASPLWHGESGLRSCRSALWINYHVASRLISFPPDQISICAPSTRKLTWTQARNVACLSARSSWGRAGSRNCWRPSLLAFGLREPVPFEAEQGCRKTQASPFPALEPQNVA